MKVGLNILSVALILVFIGGGCNSTDDMAVSGCGVTIDFDGSSIRFCPSDAEAVTLNRVQDEFIWQAMNLYYLRQAEVGNLADARFGNYEEFYRFLNGASTSRDLFFEDLLSTSDDFSWIVDDYVALENSFQGISKSFGFKFGLLRESPGSLNVYGYIQYVVEGGPASIAGLKRGDLFNKVDRIQLTEDNWEDLLTNRPSYSLTLAEFNDNVITPLANEVFLVSEVLSENPIFLNRIIESSGTKVGYLVYNQFVNNNEAHRELNDVIGRFEVEGISELILDLRYNPGGSVTTTRILCSMIYGDANASDNLATFVYNDKLSEFFNSPVRFTESLPTFDEGGKAIGEEPLNRLSNLSRIIVLTSGRTASASELLIVGLDPYMEVITIGTTTVGKNEASLTLYDTKSSLFLDRSSDDHNTAHTYAIQPIVSRLANSVGFSDYEDGLTPNVVIDERNFLGELRPLGDLDEPLLAEAMAIIQGTARRAIPKTRVETFQYRDRGREVLEKTLLEPQYVPQITE